MENFIFEDKTFQADHFLPLSPAWPGLSVKTALLAGSRAARAPTQQPACAYTTPSVRATRWWLGTVSSPGRDLNLSLHLIPVNYITCHTRGRGVVVVGTVGASISACVSFMC